jgi:murein DD-endopeptidase MepM/ murein hydrolase activator NlpD
MTHVLETSRAAPRSRWHRISRHATTKLGAFGATAALAIGACGPAATQCAPAPGPAPTTTTTVVAPAVDILLAAKPVQAPCRYTDTWGVARGGGRVHLGTDITAAEGQEVYAVQTGEITKLYSEATDALAGNGVRLRQPDGTFYFYAHMSALAPGIAAGTQVTAGQLLGWVGHTGNAGVDHLHLEIHPQGGAAVNSYPIIVASGGAC